MTTEPNMVGVNPAADPSWVADRDRAGRMTSAEAGEYYQHLAFNPHSDRHETGGDEITFADEGDY